MCRLLIAEDDVLIRMTVADILCEAGYHVMEAGDADEALSIFRSGAAVDLLFSDIKMPGSMDGCDLATLIRADYPSTRIVLTSGYSDALLRERDKPEDVLISKPYEPAHLLATIRAVMEEPLRIATAYPLGPSDRLRPCVATTDTGLDSSVDSANGPGADPERKWSYDTW